MSIPEDTIAPRTMAIDDFNDLKVQMDEFQSKVHQFLITKRQDLAARSENFWNSESCKLKKIEELKGKLRELSTHQSSLEEGTYRLFVLESMMFIFAIHIISC